MKETVHRYLIFDAYDGTFYTPKNDDFWVPLSTHAYQFTSQREASDELNELDCDYVLRHRLRIVLDTPNMLRAALKEYYFLLDLERGKAYKAR